MKIFDSHVHTICSHDGVGTIDQMCNAGIMKGYSGLTVTDHADMAYYGSMSDILHIRRSLESTKAPFKIDVLSGVEIGDAHTNMPLATELVSSLDFDAVLCSCHLYATLSEMGTGYKKGQFDYFSKAPEDELRAFLSLYYDRLLYNAMYFDYDILTHLTLPFRYICAMGKRQGFYPEDYMEKIEKILKTAIERGKAVELNTSGFGSKWNQFMPDEKIMKLYYSMGGRLVTIGTDAHSPGHIGNGFSEGAEMLKSAGFGEYFYYKNRQAAAESLF